VVCASCIGHVVENVEPSSSVKLPVSEVGVKDRCNSMELSDLFLTSHQSEMPAATPVALGSVSESQLYRGELRALIMSGDIDSAFTSLSKKYP
jgi:hypothetical protein